MSLPTSAWILRPAGSLWGELTVILISECLSVNARQIHKFSAN